MDDLSRLISRTSVDAPQKQYPHLSNHSMRRAASATTANYPGYGITRPVSRVAFDRAHREKVSDIFRMAEIVAMTAVDRNDFMRDVDTGGVILSDTDVRAVASYYGMTTFVSGKRTLLFRIASVLFGSGRSGARHLARIIYSGTVSDDAVSGSHHFGDDVVSGTVFPGGRTGPFGPPPVSGPGPSPPPENTRGLARSRLLNGPVLDNNGEVLRTWVAPGVIPGAADRWSNEFRSFYHRLEWAATMLFLQMVMASDPNLVSSELYSAGGERCLMSWVQDAYERHRIGEAIYRRVGAPGPENIHFVGQLKDFLNRQSFGGGDPSDENRVILRAKGLPTATDAVATA